MFCSPVASWIASCLDLSSHLSSFAQWICLSSYWKCEGPCICEYVTICFLCSTPVSKDLWNFTKHVTIVFFAVSRQELVPLLVGRQCFVLQHDENHSGPWVPLPTSLLDVPGTYEVSSLSHRFCKGCEFHNFHSFVVVRKLSFVGIPHLRDERMW